MGISTIFSQNSIACVRGRRYPAWVPRTQVHLALFPIPPCSNLLGTILHFDPFAQDHTSFIWAGFIWTPPWTSVLPFSEARHSHRMWTNVFTFASRLLHEGFFSVPLYIECTVSWHVPLGAQSSLQCFLSTTLMNWTHLSVGLFKHCWLIPFSSYYASFPGVLGRRYAAAKAAVSTSILNSGKSKSISNTFVGVVLIASMIKTRAALCRRSSSDIVGIISVLSYCVQMDTHHNNR